MHFNHCHISIFHTPLTLRQMVIIQDNTGHPMRSELQVFIIISFHQNGINQICLKYKCHVLQQQKCCMLIINKTKNLTLWCRTIKRESKTIETLHTDSGTFVTVHRHPRSITPHNVKDQSGLPCNRETNIDPKVSPHPPPQHRPAIS